MDKFSGSSLDQDVKDGRRIFGIAMGGFFGCFAIVFALVLTVTIVVYGVIAFVGVKVWNAPAVQEFIEGEPKEVIDESTETQPGG